MAKKNKFEGTNVYGVLGVIVVVAIVVFIFLTRTPAQAPTGAITAFPAEEGIEETEVQEETTEATAQPTTTAPTAAVVTATPSQPREDTRTLDEQLKYGSWCVRTNYDPVKDPEIEVDRTFWVASNNYYVNKYTLDIEKTLEGSDLIMASALTIPLSEFAYQSYEFKNLNIEGRVKGKDRAFNIPEKYTQQSVKGMSYAEKDRSEDIYLLWHLNDVKVGDVVQYKIDYDFGSTHYTVCKEEDLVVTADKPTIDLKIVNKNSFNGGPQWYSADFTFSGTDLDNPSRNIFKQVAPAVGEIKPYAAIVYKEDFIKSYEPYLYYEVKVDEIPGACSDPANCKYTLSFSTGDDSIETWNNICKGDAYLVVGVYRWEDEQAAEVFYKLDPNSDIAAFCAA